MSKINWLPCVGNWKGFVTLNENSRSANTPLNKAIARKPCLWNCRRKIETTNNFCELEPALHFNMPIHIAITRQVRPGCEAEFQQALREFFQTSFAHDGVLGVTMIVPPPDSDAREFGVLRTFTDEKARDEFYQSPMFKDWEARIASLVEGEWSHRPLCGLEAWFRAPSGPPPRWKMAAVTLLGVYPVSLLSGFFIAPYLRSLPLALYLLIASALMVACLTWIVMPQLTRWLKPWLSPLPHQKDGNKLR